MNPHAHAGARGSIAARLIVFGAVAWGACSFVQVWGVWVEWRRRGARQSGVFSATLRLGNGGLWSELRVELVVELCSDVRAAAFWAAARSMAVHASASAAGTGGLMVMVDAAELLRSRVDLDLRVGVSAYGSVSWMSEMLLPCQGGLWRRVVRVGWRVEDIGEALGSLELS
jgi:hypothetical protein